MEAALWIWDIVLHAIARVPALPALACLMLLDIVTGSLHAVIKREANSSASRNGVLRKVMMLSLVAAGCGMDLVNDDLPWANLIAMFWCVTEMWSIMENASRSGLPLPKEVTERLSKVHGKAAPEAPPLTVGIVPMANATTVKDDGDIRNSGVIQ